MIVKRHNYQLQLGELFIDVDELRTYLPYELWTKHFRENDICFTQYEAQQLKDILHVDEELESDNELGRRHAALIAKAIDEYTVFSSHGPE